MAGFSRTPDLVDPRFLTFIKYVPDKYLQTIDQLNQSLFECEQWKKTCKEMQEQMEDLKKENMTLLTENVGLKRKLSEVAVMDGLRNASAALENVDHEDRRSCLMLGGIQEQNNCGNHNWNPPENQTAALEELMEEDDEESERCNSASNQGVTGKVEVLVNPPPGKISVNYSRIMIFSGNFGLEFDSSEIAKQNSGSVVLSSSRPDEIQQLLKNMEVYGYVANSSPFPNRRLVLLVNDHNPKERNRFFEDLKSLLKKFGTDVNYFSFTLCADLDPHEWYYQMRDWLRRMPNLETVCLEIMSETFENSTVWIDDELLEKLEEKMNYGFALPHLQNLVCLVAENIPGFVVDAALEQCEDSLEKLQVTSNPRLTIQSWQIAEYTCSSKLKELSISFNNMKQVRQLKLAIWDLKILTLRVLCQLTCADLQDIFDILRQRFEKSLKALRLTIFSPMDPNAQLTLPKLQTLEVYFGDAASLNFIQGSESLEILKMRLTQKQSDLATDIIKFSDCLSSMQKSNIWLLVSNLKRVEITVAQLNGADEVYFSERPKTEEM